MNKNLTEMALPQLDDLIQKFETIRKQCRYDDLTDTPKDIATEFLAASSSAVHRLAGSGSEFAKQLEKLDMAFVPHNPELTLLPLSGIIKALRNDIESGYLTNLREIIHSDLFSDFLDMGEHLLSEGYKDPAAVMVGGVLEEHIRKLCGKNNIEVTELDRKGNLRPKKADAMNGELLANKVYSKFDTKSVTAWLDLRNKAAHGKYDEYTLTQVELLLQSIRDFITRYPA